LKELGELIICGAGGHGAVVGDTAVAAGYVLVGVIDAVRPVDGERPPFGGVPWLGSPEDPDESLAELIRRGALIHAAIGDADIRRRWHAIHPGHAATIVHPSATVSPSAEIGSGTFIGPRAVVNARAVIGEGVIVNSGAIVEHDARIGRFTHLGPGAVALGEATVGESVLVGANATILPAIRIGDGATIGAGSVVTRGIHDGAMAFGNPARPR